MTSQQPRVVSLNSIPDPGTIAPKVVSLGHVKKDDPKVIAPPVPKRIMAWPGGKISSNKEQALAKFVEKLKDKLSNGQEVTQAQRKIIADWDNSKRGESVQLSSSNTDGNHGNNRKRKKPVLGPPVNGVRKHPRQLSNKQANRRGGKFSVKSAQFQSKPKQSRVTPVHRGKEARPNNAPVTTIRDKLLKGLSASR